MQTADKIAAASLFVSAVAFAVALFALWKGNRNSSVATLVALNIGFRQSWESFLAAQDDDRRFFCLSELMNMLEIACAIQIERSLSGVSKGLMKQYLDDVLTLLIKTPYTNEQIKTMLSRASTFQYIRRVLKAERERNTLSVTIPPAWYQ